MRETYTSYINRIEDSNWYGCSTAAKEAGYTDEQAEMCENGQLKCKTCPWKPTKCPRCKGPIGTHPALSRRDNKTDICSGCGTAEAMFDLIIHLLKNEADRTHFIEAEREWLLDIK